MILKENKNSNIAVSDTLIGEINQKWEDVRALNSILVTLKDEPEYKDIIPVVEQILEDEHSNIGQLEQIVELIAPKATEIETGKEETMDILDDEGIELKMNENYSNTPKKFETVVDNPTYAMANEEHDENKKNYDKAMKENEEAALSTIPEEGYTGKKVKSPTLKKMHLSESLFSEQDRLNDVKMMHETMRCMNDEDAYFSWIYEMPDQPSEEDFEDFAYNDEAYTELRNVFDEIYERYKDGGLYRPSEEVKQWLEDNLYDDIELLESLNESADGDDMEVRLMKYIKKFQNHYKINPNAMGKALQEIGKSLDILNTTNESLQEELEEIDREGFVSLNKETTEPGKYYILNDQNPVKAIYADDDAQAIEKYRSEVDDSLKLDIIEEQLNKYKAGKMPNNWNPNTYLENLVKKNYISESQAKKLEEGLN